MVDEKTLNEEQSVPQETKENTESDTSAGKSVIQKATEAAERAEKAAAALKAENDRKEKLAAETMLSSSAGGRVEPQEPKEETPKEYADKVLAGQISGNGS
jgi:hypothetical protein